MNYSSQLTGANALSIELATLMENIDSRNPGYANFSVPTLVATEDNETIYTSNSNIANKNSVLSVGSTTVQHTVKLYVPLEFTIFYGRRIIPKGTRFIICFIGGDLNDIRIIGRYDNDSEVK